MEAASIFALAKYRRIKAASIFTISDHLHESNWEPKFHLVYDHLKQLFYIAKETLIS